MEEISSVAFRLNVVNGFPVNANTQLYFVDDNNGILDSLFTTASNRIIEAAETDNNGNVTMPTTRGTDEAFDGTRLQHLFDAKKIIIKATIQTKDAPNSVIEILDDYKLDFKIGVRTKLNMQF
jgi:hypothetical protein